MKILFLLLIMTEEIQMIELINKYQGKIDKAEYIDKRSE